MNSGVLGAFALRKSVKYAKSIASVRNTERVVGNSNGNTWGWEGQTYVCLSVYLSIFYHHLSPVQLSKPGV